MSPVVCSEDCQESVQATATSLVVTTTKDVVNASDGVLSLREAISKAGTSGYSSTITFSSSLKGKTISLTGGELTIKRSMKIDASALADASLCEPGLTVDGCGKSRIFNAWYSNVGLTVRGVNLTGGSAPTGFGGAIQATSQLMLDSCVLTGNKGGYGGAVYLGQATNATFKNTVFADNYATYAGGAFYANKVDAFGIINCTIVQNDCAKSSNTFAGGFTAFSSTIELRNSIVAANTAGNDFDIYIATDASINGRYVLTNFSDWTTFESIFPFYSLTDTFVNATSGDYRLSSHSPGVDAGKTSYSTSANLTKDVGGRARVVGSSIDLGAYERASGDPTTARLASDWHNDFYIDVIYDADKKMDTDEDSGDSNLCWAGAASNALWFTQWGRTAGFADEEDVFHQSFQACFPNKGGNAYSGFRWFIDGTAYSTVATVDGGSYYKIAMEAESESAYRYIGNSDLDDVDSIVEATDLLRSGCGITISVGWYKESSGLRSAGHELSLYGYSYNPQLLPTERGYITKLYVADSNDYGRLSGKLDKKLQTLTLSWSDYWEMYV
ncbi:MAG: hypothetical protein II655_12840, partial [Thermoguttaceae bacterium]|nr:hypothetical protein [Thermoguttaceae bacterium]